MALLIPLVPLGLAASDDRANTEIKATYYDNFVEAVYVPHVEVDYSSCVTLARALTGFSEPIGQARYWPKNSDVPVEGGIVITNESPFGHVGYILAIRGDILILDEANWIPNERTRRELNINSPLIEGFWRP